MKKRILSAMLALLIAFGTFGVFCTVPVSVAAEEVAGGTEGSGTTPTDPDDEKYKAVVEGALNTSYASAQDKLDRDENMELLTIYGNYELYANRYTGEVAVKDVQTGQILLSNPYNVPSYSSIQKDTRYQLLSQIAIGYTDNGVSNTFYSYNEAAARGQIKVKNIKNGIRVDYALGREQANYLAPGSITQKRMEEVILSVMVDLTNYNNEYVTYDYSYKSIATLPEDDLTFKVKNFLAAYLPYDPWEDGLADKVLQSYLTQFPFLKNAYDAWTAEVKAQHADTDGDDRVSLEEWNALDKATQDRLASFKKPIYHLQSGKTAKEKRVLENYLKELVPLYTYEERDKDHEETGYVAEEVEPPLFKLALEYTLNDNGLDISLPANSIRFNDGLYALEYISPLQFFGAGDLNDEGYIFYPDGGGAIFYYEDLLKKSASSITGKVYGVDYAYHEISGKHQESIRMPVFGAVNSKNVPVLDQDGNPVMAPDESGTPAPVTKKVTEGFMAILHQGDAMANITAAWGGSRHNFASVYTTYYPRPKDTYELSGSVSVGGDNTWTVESSRKYTGSYKLQIVMLADAAHQPTLEAAGRPYFEASYVGMAKAYNNYLVNITGVLKPLSASDVKDGNLPLYIESFGTVPDTQKILSMPVEVNVPLTTFDNVKQMYKDLKDNGITNVQFKLTGFANGGMYSTYPTKLDWMNEVGGADGFKSLLTDARGQGYGIYPDFDFMYVTRDELFDGVDLQYAAARTIDNRYSNRRVYDATYQEFVSYFDICVTPSMVREYYNNFTTAFKGYDPLGISVSTLGSDLNSDFGDRVPTNREDSKKIISGILAEIDKDYRSVMTSGGNAYALAYTDHLLNAAIDSSRFASASRSVPFVGMVLHGYVNFSGSAINRAGNIKYQILKAIENGASVYFTLSYDNTEILKEFKDLSQYYSVNYDIWAFTEDLEGNRKPGELFDVYNAVNQAIGGLQTAKIVGHQFLTVERTRTQAEKDADAARLEAALAAATAAATTEAQKNYIKDLRAKFENGEIGAGGDLGAFEVEDEAIQAILDSYALQATVTDSEATDGDDYKATKYTIDDGSVVLVSYEGGHSFILNYNVYSVDVTIGGQTYTIDQYGYQPITM